MKTAIFAIVALGILFVTAPQGSCGWKSRIIEVSPNKTVVWEADGFTDLWDAERLPNGNTLAVSGSAIMEVNSSGGIVREIKKDIWMRDAECLENGNILVASWRGGIREYDWNGTVVSMIKTAACDVERLPNGNTLISTERHVIELDRNGKKVWDSGYNRENYIVDVERLPNGNTLMVMVFGYPDHAIIEMAPNGTIVWQFQKEGYWSPHDAERLPNGDTLIADAFSRSVIRISREGKITWQVRNVRRFGDRPVDVDWLPNGNILITIVDVREGVIFCTILILLLIPALRMSAIKTSLIREQQQG